jgi:hypothetical protein
MVPWLVLWQAFRSLFAKNRVILGSFKVATYWPLKPLLISYLFVFYCQSTNKWM